MASRPPIVLTTDFGLSDPYVGVMKGVILSINPSATIVDLTHQVQPQNLVHASFLLKTSHPFFPPDSIHVAVVDPGVGTSRKAILLISPAGSFLAPDNGILSGVLEPFLDTHPADGGAVPVPDRMRRVRAGPTRTTSSIRSAAPSTGGTSSLPPPPTCPWAPLRSPSGRHSRNWSGFLSPNPRCKGTKSPGRSSTWTTSATW